MIVKNKLIKKQYVDSCREKIPGLFKDHRYNKRLEGLTEEDILNLITPPFYNIIDAIENINHICIIISDFVKMYHQIRGLGLYITINFMLDYGEYTSNRFVNICVNMDDKKTSYHSNLPHLIEKSLDLVVKEINSL